MRLCRCYMFPVSVIARRKLVSALVDATESSEGSDNTIDDRYARLRDEPSGNDGQRPREQLPAKFSRPHS